MSPFLQVHPRLVTLLRWVAHVLSVLILFFFAVMIGGEAVQGRTPQLEPREILIFAALAVQLLGLFVAFRKETPGGLMVLVGFLLHAALQPKAALNPFFAVLPVTGLLRLSCAWLERHQGSPPPAVRGKRASHRIALTVSLVVALFLGLACSEIFMSPPLMAPRHVAVPAGLVGGWQGQARVANAWVRQRRLPVKLAVDANGMAEGTIGDARFLEGKLRPARSWFGRALRMGTDYVFVGLSAGMQSSSSVGSESSPPDPNGGSGWRTQSWMTVGPWPSRHAASRRNAWSKRIAGGRSIGWPARSSSRLPRSLVVWISTARPSVAA